MVIGGTQWLTAGRTAPVIAESRPLRRRGGTIRSVAVRLVTNPHNDDEFARVAEQLIERVETPEELERLLRERYQRARVVPGVTDITERWYAYRDGRWVESQEQ